MKNTGRKITIVVFCVLIFGFAVACMLDPDASYSVRERDVLTTLADVTEGGDIAMTLSDIAAGDFQENYEAYVDDQFFLREAWIDLSASLSLLIGKSDVNGVYVGSDGYLFEKYTEEYFLPDDEDEDPVWENNVGVLAEFTAAMAQRYGSDAVSLLMIPAKANAMPDYLPALAQPYPEEEVLEELCMLIDDEAETAEDVSADDEELSEDETSSEDAGEDSEAGEDAADDGVTLSEEIFLDLTDTLQAHQDEYIYYRTDHHWTTLGAYYACAAYLEKIGLEVPALDDYEAFVGTDGFYGTTYNKLQMDVEADIITLYQNETTEDLTVEINDGEITADSLYFTENLTDYTDDEILEMVENDEDVTDMYSVFLNGNYQKIVIETGSDTGRTLLLIKDSFANSFVPFLTGSFDTIILYDTRYSGDNDIAAILDQYGDQITDVLILYNVEKFMEETSVDDLSLYAEAQ